MSVKEEKCKEISLSSTVSWRNKALNSYLYSWRFFFVQTLQKTFKEKKTNMKKDNNKLKTSFCTITTKNFIHLLFSFFICPCHFFRDDRVNFFCFQVYFSRSASTSSCRLRISSFLARISRMRSSKATLCWRPTHNSVTYRHPLRVENYSTR